MATFAKASFGHASYAAFRPSYPPSLYKTVLSYHRGPKKLCLDLGCGPGTATREMSQHFEHIIGTDPSAGMVKQGQTNASHLPNIEFREGFAERTPSLGDGSVDCLWPELRRLLRPGGTVAFWGYKDHVFVGFPRASEIMMRYAYDQDKLWSYWPQPGRSYLQDQIRVVQPPGQDFEDVRRIEYEPGTEGRCSGEGTMFMEKSVTVGACKEYVRTWSYYHGWKEKFPEQVARSRGGEGDIMDRMFDEIAEGDEQFRDDENVVDIEWGSAVVMARRK